MPKKSSGEKTDKHKYYFLFRELWSRQLVWVFTLRHAKQSHAKKKKISKAQLKLAYTWKFQMIVQEETGHKGGWKTADKRWRRKSEIMRDKDEQPSLFSHKVRWSTWPTFTPLWKWYLIKALRTARRNSLQFCSTKREESGGGEGRKAELECMASVKCLPSTAAVFRSYCENSLPLGFLCPHTVTHENNGLKDVG